MKSIFWKRVICEYESEGKTFRFYGYEKRNLKESIRLLFIVPFGWAVLIADWVYAE